MDSSETSRPTAIHLDAGQKAIAILAYLAPSLSFLPVATMKWTIAIPLILWLMTKGQTSQTHISRAFDLCLLLLVGVGAILLVALVMGGDAFLYAAFACAGLIVALQLLLVASVLMNATWGWLWKPRILKPAASA